MKSKKIDLDHSYAMGIRMVGLKSDPNSTVVSVRTYGEDIKSSTVGFVVLDGDVPHTAKKFRKFLSSLRQ